MLAYRHESASRRELDKVLNGEGAALSYEDQKRLAREKAEESAREEQERKDREEAAQRRELEKLLNGGGA